MNTKEFPSAMIENMTAVLSPSPYGLKLEIINEKAKLEARDPSSDYLWKGYWIITKKEASQIIDFMVQPFNASQPENQDPSMWLNLEAEHSYYLDVPGDPRIYVDVTRFGDGSAAFGIGDHYKYRFPKEQMQEVLTTLKTYHGL